MSEFERLPGLRQAFTARSRLMEQISERLLRMARQFAPNFHIKESITVKSVEDTSGKRIIITLRATAPDARAYEYGSGIHSRRSIQSPKQSGPKGPINIQAKNAPFLVFPWQGHLIHTVSVQHPGVEPANNGEGYLRKAVKETKKQNKKDLASGLAFAVRSDIVGRFRFRSNK